MMSERPKIGVLGAGAIGSCIGIDLTAAGHDVMIFDQWPAHVEAMRANGLRVRMPDHDALEPVQAHHLCDLASLQLRIDVAFVCVKAYDTAWTVELPAPYLAHDGVVVGVQNSMTDETIAKIVGRSRTMG